MGDVADYLKWILEPVKKYGIVGHAPDTESLGDMVRSISSGGFGAQNIANAMPDLSGLLSNLPSPIPTMVRPTPWGYNRTVPVRTLGQTADNLQGLLGTYLQGTERQSAGSQQQQQQTFTDYRRPQHVAPSFDSLSKGLQDNMRRLLAARSKAIRSSGSAAGARYNDAIAQVQAQITQMEEAKKQSGELYQTVSQQSGGLFDQAIQNANFGPQAKAAQQDLAAKTLTQRRQDFDKIYSDTNSLLSRSGVDDQAAAEVSAKIKDVQNQIENSSTMQEGYKERIAELSGTLAEAAAKYAKASTMADLGRKKVEIQLGLDKQLSDLAEQKDQLIKAKSRAAASARAATASQYGGLIPKSADEYAQWHVAELLREANVDPGQQSIVMALAREASNPYTMDDGTAFEKGASGYGDVDRLVLEHVANGELPWTKEQVGLYAPIVWQAVQTYKEGMSRYQDVIAGGNATYLAPNTIDRVAANYAQSYTPSLSEKDIEDYAFSEAANLQYTPRRPESYSRNLGF